MNQDHCLYCGSSQITVIDEGTRQLNFRILQCQNCQVRFTDLEQRFEADGTPLSYKPEFDLGDAESALEYIPSLAFICPRWNAVLELLGHYKYPLKHPLEFLIYRSAAQAGSALQQTHVLSLSPDYNPLYVSNSLLDMLQYNLRHLDYYLPADDAEKRYQILRHISIALTFFGITDIKADKLLGSLQDKYIISTLQKRHEILNGFAEYLEELRTDAHGADYLSAAKLLWEQCVEEAVERVLPTDSSGPRRISPIPAEDSECIKKKVRELDAEIRSYKTDSAAEDELDFEKKASYKKLPVSAGSISATPLSAKGTVFFSVIGAVCLAGFFWLMISDYKFSQRIGSIMDYIFSDTMHYILLIFTGAVVIFAAAIIFQAHRIIEGPRKEDEKKCRQLYKRLYKK